MLGITIGCASVISLLYCGQLATYAMINQFSKLGTNILNASISMPPNQSTSSLKISAQEPLSLTLFQSMADDIKDIDQATGYSTHYLHIKNHKKQIFTTAVGAQEPLISLAKLSIDQGRFLHPADKKQAVVVLGYKAWHLLSTSKHILHIGDQLYLDDHYYTIIGILKPWPNNFFFATDFNKSLFIPIDRAQMILNKQPQEIVMRVSNENKIKTVQADVTQQLHDWGYHQVFFRSPQALIEQIQAQRKNMNMLLAVIGSVALFVGGIGIMNIQLISVLERRQEIGIRMAVGARRKDIKMLFLFEALMICGLGSLLGIVLGLGTTYLIALQAHWTMIWLSWPIALSFSVCMVIGLFFGYYPASKAASWSPVMALRQD